MKKYVSRSVAFLVLLIFISSWMVGCAKKQEVGGTNIPDTEKPIVLKAAHVLSTTSYLQKGLEKFAELVEQKTGGKVKVEIYPGGVLGGERDNFEAMQLGALDVAPITTALSSSFLPKFGAFDLPFIFRDTEHAFKTADGPVGQQLLKELESQKVVGLGYWTAGFRSVYTSKVPVRKPEDLEGLKIRLMENSVHANSFKCLGAIPVPMAWGELYTALQQGTVDGAENSIPAIYTSKHYEVCKNLSLTRHFCALSPLLISKATYDRLPEKYRTAIREAGVESSIYQREVFQQMESEQINKLKEAGVNIIEVDRNAFHDLCKDVYAMFKDKIPEELVQQIRNIK